MTMKDHQEIKREKNKMKTKVAPAKAPEDNAPMFQEVSTIEDIGNNNIPTVTQDEIDNISKVPRLSVV